MVFMSEISNLFPSRIKMKYKPFGVHPAHTQSQEPGSWGFHQHMGDPSSVTLSCLLQVI